MRIEYEGVIEQQPSYQHVGYMSAAWDGLTTASWRTDYTPFAGVAVLGLAIALIATRQTISTRRWGWTVGIALGLAMIGVAAAGGWSERSVTGTMAPQYYGTLYGLEELVAEADAAAAVRGRPLHECEWQALHTQTPRDGWDHEFVYTRYRDGVRDSAGHGYLIASPGQYGSLGAHAITSEWLGADGRFGTDDDDTELRSSLNGVDLTRYRHYQRAE